MSVLNAAKLSSYILIINLFIIKIINFIIYYFLNNYMYNMIIDLNNIEHIMKNSPIFKQIVILYIKYNLK